MASKWLVASVILGLVAVAMCQLHAEDLSTAAAKRQTKHRPTVNNKHHEEHKPKTKTSYGFDKDFGWDADYPRYQDYYAYGKPFPPPKSPDYYKAPSPPGSPSYTNLKYKDLYNQYKGTPTPPSKPSYGDDDYPKKPHTPTPPPSKPSYGDDDYYKSAPGTPPSKPSYGDDDDYKSSPPTPPSKPSYKDDEYYKSGPASPPSKPSYGDDDEEYYKSSPASPPSKPSYDDDEEYYKSSPPSPPSKPSYDKDDDDEYYKSSPGAPPPSKHYDGDEDSYKHTPAPGAPHSKPYDGEGDYHHKSPDSHDRPHHSYKPKDFVFYLKDGVRSTFPRSFSLGVSVRATAELLGSYKGVTKEVGSATWSGVVTQMPPTGSAQAQQMITININQDDWVGTLVAGGVGAADLVTPDGNSYSYAVLGGYGVFDGVFGKVSYTPGTPGIYKFELTLAPQRRRSTAGMASFSLSPETVSFELPVLGSF